MVAVEAEFSQHTFLGKNKDLGATNMAGNALFGTSDEFPGFTQLQITMKKR